MPLTNDDIYQKLLQAQTGSGKNYLSQMSNAFAGLDAMKNMQGITPQQKEQYGNMMKSQAATAGLGASTALLGGLSGIVGTTKNLASIADTSKQDAAIQQMGSIGQGGYSSYDQVTADYNRLNSITPDLSYDTIRGVDTKQKVGGVLSATAAGAATGAQIGGPWGALAGGVIGLGSSLAGVFVGDRNARIEQQLKQAQAKQATELSQTRMRTGIDDLAQSNFRNDYANRAARGGSIERRQQDLQAFADRIMHRQKQNDVTHSSGIVRQHCKGGTLIRIKR